MARGQPAHEGGTGPVTVSQVEALVTPLLEKEGYEVVLVEMLRAWGHPSLRISIDRLDQAAVSLDDCVRVTGILGKLAELDAFFPGSYNLEVSSPGVERPLVRERDFVRFLGEKAWVSTLEPLDGRRRFTGKIVKVADGEVCLDMGRPGVVSIRIEQIAKAHLKPDTAELFGRRDSKPLSMGTGN